MSFTRSPEAAAYFALMERFNDEGRGAILIFDRDSLLSQYKINLIHEKWVPVGDTGWHDEAEEEIWVDVTDVAKHLIGLVYEPKTLCSHKHKVRNQLFGLEIDARLEELHLPVPNWCRRPPDLERNLKKKMRAYKALSAGIGIAKVAEQVGLSIGTVRRIAGGLPRRGARDWSLAEIVLSWGLIDRSEKLQEDVATSGVASGSYTPDASDGLVKVSAAKMDALMAYSGMSRDDVENSLREELPDLIMMLVQRIVASNET